MSNRSLLFHQQRVVSCHCWPTTGHQSQLKRRRFFIWLVILWLASLFLSARGAGPADRDSRGRTNTNNNVPPPSVSVRMSTSIVEAANFQPNPDEVLGENKTASSRLNQQHQQDHIKQSQVAGRRILLGQDSPPVRKDQNQWQSMINLANQQQFHLQQQQQQQQATYPGRILDPGYRWSVSTSRDISAPAIRVHSLPGDGANPIGQPSGHFKAAGHKQAQRGLVRRILDGGHQTIVDLRCEGRGVGRMLKSILMLGSSLLAASIPLAVLYSNLIGAGAGAELATPSNRRTSVAPGGGLETPLSFIRHLSLQSRVDSVMGWIERSLERLPNFPRLHPQECVKRSICEAHNEPDKYGAIGFMLRLFFPATNLSSTDRMDNMEYKVINKYRHAAGYGLNRRIDSNGTNVSACGEKYEDCLISLLDVARNMMDVLSR